MSNGVFRVAVLSVGSEMLSGDQVDTNATWLATRIRQLGGRDLFHLAVGDTREEIVDCLRWLAGRVDGIVVGGGLGPTSDDLTRDAVATAVGAPLERRDDLAEHIEQRFRDFGVRMPADNLRQAEVPTGATAWPPLGTAPGFTTMLGDTVLWVLPGVPWELQGLFDAHVAPDLLQRSGGVVTVTRVVHVTGSGESAIAEQLTDAEAAAIADDIEVGYLATGHEVLVKLTARGSSRAAVAAMIQPHLDNVVTALGPTVAGLDDMTGESVVVAALRERGLTVAVAESATAGMVTARLASVPGASAVLRGGVVVYATDTKTLLADVPAAMLEQHPPVSAEVTAALAEGVRRRLGADIGLATTGVAGPDEQDGVAVGTCFWAVATASDTVVKGRQIPGDREAVRGRLATASLDLLRRHLLATDTA